MKWVVLNFLKMLKVILKNLGWKLKKIIVFRILKVKIWTGHWHDHGEPPQINLFICFTCNTKRNIGTNCYNEGGIACYLLDKTIKKVLDKRDTYLRDKNNHFFMAVKCLELKLSDSYHDIYVADVFHHHLFDIRFTHRTWKCKWDCDFSIKKW